MSILRYAKKRVALFKAIWQIKSNEAERAIQTLKHVIDMNQPDEALLKILATSYWQARKWDESMSCLYTLEKECLDVVGYKWTIGVNLLTLSRYDKAMQYLEYCAKEMPENDIMLSGLGLNYLYLEMYEKAEEVLLRANRIAAWNPDVCCGMPLLYLATSRFDFIEQFISDYIDKFPNLYPGYLCMGDHIQYRLYEPVRALVWYEKGISLLSNPETNKYLEKYALLDGLRYRLVDAYCEALVNAGQKKKALQKIKQQLLIDTHNPIHKARLVEYFLNTGDYPLAEQEAQSAIETNPKWPEYFHLFSTALLKQNRNDDALKIAKESLEMDNDNINSWIVLGNAEKQLESWGNAINAYKEVLKRSPFDTDVLGNLSFCFNQLNQYKDSIVVCEKHTTLDPNNSSAWLMLAMAHHNLNQDAEARIAVKKAIELGRLDSEQINIVHDLLR